MYLVVLIKCRLHCNVKNFTVSSNSIIFIRSVGGGSTIVYKVPSLGISVGNEQSFAWSSRGIWFAPLSEQVFAG